MSGRKIVVGMSGGVDSSMSLVLLKKQGWHPIGVSLKYAVWQDSHNLLRENVCCSSQSFAIARRVCQSLKVPWYVIDVSCDFQKKVIAYFISELKKGRTPNPCIVCNRHLKFKKLFEWAKKHQIDYVATGHYAQIRFSSKDRVYQLVKAKDTKKDQTYSLSFLFKKWLGKLVFPLGNYTKEEVFKLADQQGFSFYLKRKQSQDFCFVANKCLNCFLTKELGLKEGLIKNKKGKILGKHQGLHFYTIGQRKGINLSTGPYFVIKKDLKNNVLLVSSNPKDLLTREAVLSPVNFVSCQKPKKETKIEVKIRSQHQAVKARLIPLVEGKKFKLIFNQPQMAVTPGQFAVFYKKGVCLGGGKIIKVCF